MTIILINPREEYKYDNYFLDSWSWNSFERKTLDEIIKEFCGYIDFKLNDKLRELILLKNSKVRQEFAYLMGSYNIHHQRGGKYSFPNNIKMTPDEYNEFYKRKLLLQNNRNHLK